MKIYSLITSLAQGRGGLTKSVMSRASSFADAGFETTILTLDYKGNFADELDHDAVVRKLKNSGILSEKVNVRNFFLEQTGYSPDLADLVVVQSAARRSLEDSYKRVRKAMKGNVFFDNDGRIRSIKDGNFETVFSQSGKPSFEVLWDGFHHYTEDGSLARAQAAWISSTLMSCDCLFVDQRQLYSFVRSIGSKFKKIAVTHSTHYRHPHVLDGPMAPDYVDLYEGGGFDLIVLLTDTQRRDAQRLGFDVTSFRVLPNLAVEPTSNITKKTPNLVVSLARFEAEKRLEHAVAVAELVAKQVPGFKLRIFGKGSKKSEIAAMVERKGLSQVVELADFTPDPLGALATAQCSLLTSIFEGLPLSVIESMSVGTPVVAYDIRFGPSDLIKDGVDGYLIEPGNIELMADKVVGLLSNPDAAKRLALAALDASASRNLENFRRRWVDAVNSLH